MYRPCMLGGFWYPRRVQYTPTDVYHYLYHFLFYIFTNTRTVAYIQPVYLKNDVFLKHPTILNHLKSMPYQKKACQTI